VVVPYALTTSWRVWPTFSLLGACWTLNALVSPLFSRYVWGIFSRAFIYSCHVQQCTIQLISAVHEASTQTWFKRYFLWSWLFFLIFIKRVITKFFFFHYPPVIKFRWFILMGFLPVVGSQIFKMLHQFLILLLFVYLPFIIRMMLDLWFWLLLCYFGR